MRRRCPALVSIAALALAAALGGCGDQVDDGVVDIAFIASPDALFAAGLRLDSAGQHIRAATTQGLVRFDADGNVVPALAERWIVADAGRSYIFRIAEFDLPGGRRLTAQAVRDSLENARRRLAGTSMAVDLAKVASIRAMTGRVIEFRLTSPMPEFLQLLAQPELGIALADHGTGPMTLARTGDGAKLIALPPEARGLPAQPDWSAQVQPLHVMPVTAAAAAKGFEAGDYDLVLGGTAADLPRASSSSLTRGTVRLDAAIGLFGLDVRHAEGFLATAANREALALAIDREALVRPFNIGGWAATTRLVAPGLPGDGGAVPERWSALSLEERQARARARVAAWRGTGALAPAVVVALPDGPGSDLMFASLARDFAAIGVTARRAGDAARADLVLRDRTARYAGARWFLSQFDCRVARDQCVPAADALVRQALAAPTPAAEASYLAEAERTLTDANLYIPLGAPIRWSLARASLPGFVENAWAFHPLFPLSRAPI